MVWFFNVGIYVVIKQAVLSISHSFWWEHLECCLLALCEIHHIVLSIINFSVTEHRDGFPHLAVTQGSPSSLLSLLLSDFCWPVCSLHFSEISCFGFYMSEIMWRSSFWAWLTSCNILSSWILHLGTNDGIALFFTGHGYSVAYA